MVKGTCQLTLLGAGRPERGDVGKTLGGVRGGDGTLKKDNFPLGWDGLECGVGLSKPQKCPIFLTNYSFKSNFYTIHP